jgi:signal transduction histidine kinase
MSSDRTRLPIPTTAQPQSTPPLTEPLEDPHAVIESLQAQLVACQRLALLGGMAAMVVHEFNNLLTGIMGRVQLALADGDDPAFVRKNMERALAQAQRAKSVTQLLQALAHDEPQPMEACSLAASVREAIETLTRPVEKDGLALRVDVSEELCVRACPDLLCQVLLNLLLNAREAMKDTGGTLSVIATADGDRVQIDIRDGGRGIPRELLDNVFNPFLAADPHTRPCDWHQVGLGLNVCRMIARQHGATLQALANEGRGCTFRLCWPAADGPPAPPRGRC